MRHHALSTEGRCTLRALATQSVLYGFDFDGTLVRLTADREHALLPRSIQEWLTELSKRAPCAVISERSLKDLTPRIGHAVPHVLGNHGLESPLTDRATLSRAEAICLGWTQALHDSSHALQDYGIAVDNKRYTLTFQFRGVGDPGQIPVALTALLNRLTPRPRLSVGRACVHALPPGYPGKGAAALALMRRLRQAGLFYIGDDGADEEVFESPVGLAMGIHVGKQADSRAQFYVDHQGQVEEVIRFLIHRLDRTPEALDPDDLLGQKKKTA